MALSHQARTRRTGGSAALLAALALSASTAQAQVPSSNAPPAKAQAAAAPEAREPALTRAQVDALLAQPATTLVLDVRRADEISTLGGFPAFLNIQLAELDRYLAFIPRDRAVLAVSNHANRARKAATLLSERGFKVAGVVGVQDYEAQGGVLTGRKPEATAEAKPAETARK